MKFALMLFIFLIGTSYSNATTITHSLEHLSGKTIVPFDGLNQDDAILDIGLDVGFDVGETGFAQLELVLEFDEISLAEKNQLILLLGNDYWIWFDAFPFGKKARAVSYRGMSASEIAQKSGNEYIESYLDLDIMFNHWNFDGYEYAPTDKITFGQNSYLRITTEEEGLFPHPIPETGTFALFLLGAVGLCVRRQMKQQA